MANVLTNFLVGIGFDYDERGQKKAEAGLGSIRSVALAAGAAVGGAFTLNSLTVGFAQSTDTIGKWSKTLGVSANRFSAFTRVIRHEGGSASEAISAFESLAAARSAFELGDASLATELSRFGIEPVSILDEDNVSLFDAVLLAMNQISKLNIQDQLAVGNLLGFGKGIVRASGNGQAYNDAAIAQEIRAQPISTEMITLSADFEKNLQNLNTEITAFTDQISLKLLPVTITAMSAVLDFLRSNKETINTAVDKFTIPAVVAAGVAGAGGLLKLASRGIGALGATGVAGAAAGVARLANPISASILLASLWSSLNNEDFKDLTGIDAPWWLFPPEDGSANFSAPVTPQELIENNERRERQNTNFQHRSGNSRRPMTANITLTNTLNLDGEVIDRRTRTVVEEINMQENDTTLNELVE